MYFQLTRTNRDNTDLTRGHDLDRHAQDGAKWDSVESDFVSCRLKQPTLPMTSHHHDNDDPTNNTRTNNVHDESP